MLGVPDCMKLSVELMQNRTASTLEMGIESNARRHTSCGTLYDYCSSNPSRHLKTKELLTDLRNLALTADSDPYCGPDLGQGVSGLLYR